MPESPSTIAERPAESRTGDAESHPPWIGRNNVKRGLKRATGWAAALTTPFVSRSAEPRACILVYHRIADVGFIDPRLDDWNVPPATFERQVAALSELAEIVPLASLPQRLRESAPGAKPQVCLTFDDGYANFMTQALPILERYRAPATAFVITEYIGSVAPLQFDYWSRANRGRAPGDACRVMTWGEIERCVESGLVTIGAHSHSHRNGADCTPDQLMDEAGRARETLQSRLGEEQSRVYAYPYGSSRLGNVHPAYVRAVQACGYGAAVTTDIGLAGPESDLFLLPRIQADALDSRMALRAKGFGALGPFHLLDQLRSPRRSAIS